MLCDPPIDLVIFLRCVFAPVDLAIFLGAATATSATMIHILYRMGMLAGESKKFLRLILCCQSGSASTACLYIFLQVPDWRLLRDRWLCGDFCALPEHAALSWWFIAVAPWAFAAPIFALISLRLACTVWSSIFAWLLFLASLIVLSLTIHGLR
jgi:hypothetical protein